MSGYYLDIYYHALLAIAGKACRAKPEMRRGDSLPYEDKYWCSECIAFVALNRVKEERKEEAALTFLTEK